MENVVKTWKPIMIILSVIIVALMLGASTIGLLGDAIANRDDGKTERLQQNSIKIIANDLIEDREIINPEPAEAGEPEENGKTEKLDGQTALKVDYEVGRTPTLDTNDSMVVSIAVPAALLVAALLVITAIRTRKSY